MSKRQSNLRQKFLEGRNVAQCEVCGMQGPKELFDVDHLIPLSVGGPNVPWNLWTLCPLHHRIKTVEEREMLKRVGKEHLCWACGRVTSRFFAHAQFWCNTCDFSHEKLQAMRKRLKRIL